MVHILRCLEIFRSISQTTILSQSLLELNLFCYSGVLGHYTTHRAFGKETFRSCTLWLPLRYPRSLQVVTFGPPCKTLLAKSVGQKVNNYFPLSHTETFSSKVHAFHP